MKLELWWIGKTNEKYINAGIDIYLKRIKHYHNFGINEIKDVKSTKNPEDLKTKEADAILKQTDKRDFIVLLDEKGHAVNSIVLSELLQSWLLLSAYKRIIFIVAGAFGASEKLQNRANLLLSLSSLTFSHQMIRIIFLEQLYRVSTILKNEKYHNL
jgi:23S rRNA (pseudouridine1915-N3)-methyltransferase